MSKTKQIMSWKPNKNTFAAVRDLINFGVCLPILSGERKTETVISHHWHVAPMTAESDGGGRGRVLMDWPGEQTKWCAPSRGFQPHRQSSPLQSLLMHFSLSQILPTQRKLEIGSSHVKKNNQNSYDYIKLRKLQIGTGLKTVVFLRNP